MSKLSEKRPWSNERVAVFTSYGTYQHVECITVVIQDGGLLSGGKILDSRRFWSRDYRSGGEMGQSACEWALARGAKMLAQLEEVMPLEECKSEVVRGVN